VVLGDEHGHRGCWLHTNHFLDPELAALHPPFIYDSMPRLARMRTLVDAKWGDHTVETMKSVLADHGEEGGLEGGGATAEGVCEEGGCICRHGLHAMDR